jgi:hypothetical protein
MKNLLFLILFFSLINFSFSQIVNSTSTDTNTYVIIKNDGSEYMGKIINDDGREVLIMTQKLGKIYIPKSDIRTITKVLDKKSIVGGEFYSEGPFTTRYAFTTNALPIKKGENYALVNLYGPEVHFAVTDHLNIGIMSTWAASPLVFAAKYTIPTKNEKLNFSVGTLMGTSGYFNNFNGYGGLHFANMTFGDRKNNFTFSAGYGYISSFGGLELVVPGNYNYIDFVYKSYPSSVYKGPIFSFAGMFKVGAKTSFIFDSMFGTFYSSYRSNTFNDIFDASGNYLFTQVGLLESQTQGTVAFFLMPGMRFQTKENRAFQISLAGVALFESGYAYSFPLPMCSWFFKF